MLHKLYQKQVEAWKERAVVTLVKELNEIVFVKSTNSVTGEEEELKPYIADLEGTIQINGEFDREDLKNVLSKLSSRHKDTIELIEAIIKEVESTMYVFERDKDDYLPEVYKHLKSKNEAREEIITTLQAEKELVEKES